MRKTAQTSPLPHLHRMAAASHTLKSSEMLLHRARQYVPKMTNSAHKGQSGKIGVLGGSFEYTGAPYYSAFSALKVGCDLAHVFCTEGAAVPIKSYSPELIVHPYLKSSESNSNNVTADSLAEKVSKWFNSLHVLVIGPGLGRDSLVMDTTKIIIQKAKEAKIPLILDGDGLHLVLNEPSVITGYPLAILTPNVAEFGRLIDKFNLKEDQDQLKSLCEKLGNVTIVRKGATDVISDGKEVIECTEEGSPRRCGGQGDLLTGAIAVFLGWAHQFHSSDKPPTPISPNPDKHSEKDIPYMMSAAWAGCVITRQCNKRAFSRHLRATTTPNMIEEIGAVMESLFPCGYKSAM